MTAEIIDQANELAQQRIDMSIAAHRLNHSAVSATHCEECGDPLIPERRDAFPGCKKCVSCQEDEEKRNRRM
ncbi:TraR/DksA family transcriptional regulator [Citrobacter werkmanii]|uniref:TraR/DksA family transcriptional regulator n=1 Tax=Citrobacter werkmanii TaxID=67827 RepID=UPI00351D808D